MHKILACLLSFAAVLLATTCYSQTADPASKELRIVRVTPNGEGAVSTRQIVIEFNRAVVPIGKMERDAKDIPVTFTPAVDCQWRWLNMTSLSCNLGDNTQLKEATQYQIVIKPGIAAEDGGTIAQPFTQNFVTRRPDVSSANFRHWETPGSPVMSLSFNQPVTKQSVEASLHFSRANDQSQKIAVLVEADANSGDAPIMVDTSAGKQEARWYWIVKPKSELPLASTVALKLSAGLVSANGSALGNQSRDVVQFDTFGDFQFLGLKCTSNEGREVFVTLDQAQQANELCNPLASVSLSFNAPVLRSVVRDQLVFTPAIAQKNDVENIWGVSDSQSSDLSRSHSKDEKYTISLPRLKAAQAYTVSVKPPESGVGAWLSSFFIEPPKTALTDAFGRVLSRPFTFNFSTDHRLPNFEITHSDAVIEKDIDSEVPLYVNNLKSVTYDFRSVTASGVKDKQSVTQQIPQVSDIQFAVPLGVRNMLNGTPGAVFGYVSAEPAVEKSSTRLFAQVTPYQLHIKLGHFSSLGWVTDFATGKPVEGASVSFYKDSFATLGDSKDVLATAHTNAQGIALLPGTAQIDPQLQFTPRWISSEEDGDAKTIIFARVQKGDDLALLPLSDSFAISTWRASGETLSESTQEKFGHISSWGTTAQGIYRAGDTMQYKIYVRDQSNLVLAPAPRSGYMLEIIDPTDKVVETVKDLTLNAFGALSGEFSTSKQAAIGWYNFRLSYALPQDTNDDESGEPEKLTLFPMQVLVSDFTPSPFKVTGDLNGDLFKAGQSIEVLTSAKLHSGGAYTDASARITAVLEESVFTSKHPLAQNFTFTNYNSDDEEGEEEGEQNNGQVYQQSEKLDSNGELRQSFAINEQDITYGKLTVESAVQDDRGKSVASSTSADYIGVDRFVGLRATEWMFNAKKTAAVEYLVTDERGAPVSGITVDIKIEKLVTHAARVKSAGNAYLTNYTSTWQPAGKCNGVSLRDAAMTCHFTPPEAGNYRYVASVKDTKGRVHLASTEIWVTGSDYVLWEEKTDSYLQIVPEKADYRVGDKARFLVKNPYPGAEALITVERFGVIDHFTQVFDSSTPVVELTIKPDYLPGFYLSIMIVSKRVDKPIENNTVDLGKPAFRLGYLSVPVKDKYKEMLVSAKTDQDVYRPRDIVKVQLNAKPRFVAGKVEPIELAVAVLDESVLDLVAGGKNNFDPYEGFYQHKDLDLRNFSLINRLVGRQKFEKKGANPGGDGGADLAMRNVFKFVSYWNPSIQTDAAGNASIEFEVPDNLTGWRILAIATTPTDRMGLGDASFKVNRPTEVRPVMPNQITEGDAFLAGFTVMNRTEEKRTLDVTITAKGTLNTEKAPADFKQSVMLEPYKRTTVLMPVTAGKVGSKSNIEKGEIFFSVRAGDVTDADGMEHTVPVNKKRALETAAQYGSTTEDRISQNITFPADIESDVGGVSVVVAPSVISSVEGAFRYMKNYPYLCWEQILTKGVMASHFKNLKSYVSKDFEWKDSETISAETLKRAVDFQAPNGGMAYFVAKDDYVDPYLSAYTALAFNWLRSAGYKVPEQVEQKLHGYLQTYLKRDTAPSFYTAGMNASVRASALAALAVSGKVTKQDLDRYRPHVQAMSMFGKSQFINAALRVKGSDMLVTDTLRQLMNHASESGGKFTFQENADSAYARLLSTPMRDNCTILSTLTAISSQRSAAVLAQDIPMKLVRSIMQTRKGRDHWDNTQDNMFCMNALIDYSRVYENVSPRLIVQAGMDRKVFGEARFSALRDAPVLFEKPIDAKDVGRKTTVDIARMGEGRLYYSTRLNYATRIDAQKETNSGIEIHREYSVKNGKDWSIFQNTQSLKRGDLVRVDIYLSVPAARNFVAVNDPVPGGLEPVNRDLATTSAIDASALPAQNSRWFKGKSWTNFNASRWSFYHQELRHDSVKFYSDYLPAGNYHLSYTAQAIAEGRFNAMPVFAEEMYDPDVFGRGLHESLSIGSLQ